MSASAMPGFLFRRLGNREAKLIWAFGQIASITSTFIYPLLKTTSIEETATQKPLYPFRLKHFKNSLGLIRETKN